MPAQYQNFSNPTIIPDQPIGWQAANQQTAGAINNLGSYLSKQQDTVNQMQSSLGQSLLSAKLNRLLYPNNPMYGDASVDPKIDAMLSSNPYTRQMLSRMNASLGTSGQPGQNGMPMPGNSPGGQPGATGGSPGGMSMNPVSGIQPLGGQSMVQPLSGSMSGVNPLGGNVPTGGSMEFKGPMGSMTQSMANPLGEAQVASAKAQAQANVDVPKEYATKMVGSQALAQENLARDNTQMMSVFQTLKNLHDIHSTLAQSNLAGTDIGDIASENLGHLGTLAALVGQKPADWQNAAVSPENQALLGQFVSGRNEGITRAIQPLQNQVDKTGSSRISESLLGMTEGEYGKLDDPQAMFDGKTLGTAKTLYRITLASQNYADQLKAQGIQLNGSDKNFDPDTIAQKIYDNAQAIKLSPAQNAQFNQYANNILGTQNKDYTGGSMNPVMNPQKPQATPSGAPSSMQPGSQQGKAISRTTAQYILDQAGGDPQKARIIAKTLGYQF